MRRVLPVELIGARAAGFKGGKRPAGALAQPVKRNVASGRSDHIQSAMKTMTITMTSTSTKNQEKTTWKNVTAVNDYS